MTEISLRRTAALTCLAVLAGLAGCGGGGGAVELARLDFETPEQIPAGADLDHEFVHDGAGSLHVYADEKVLLPLLETEIAGVAGDSLAVSLWGRTEVLQRAASFQLVIFSEGRDPRIVQLDMPDLRRTQDWTRRQAATVLLPDERPTRVKVSLLIPEPGQLWLDDLVLWDGSPTPDGTGE